MCASISVFFKNCVCVCVCVCVEGEVWRGRGCSKKNKGKHGEGSANTQNLSERAFWMFPWLLNTNIETFSFYVNNFWSYVCYDFPNRT